MEATDDVQTCPRHPGTETRVACVRCDTPVCPECMVSAPVGFKCPDCATASRSERGQGKPDQYVRAVAFGAGAAIVLAFVLGLAVFRNGFLSLIAAGVAGWLVAEAAGRGADGNRGLPLRPVAMGLGVLAVLGGWIVVANGDVGVAFELIVASPYRLLTFLAVVYGAYRSTG